MLTCVNKYIHIFAPSSEKDLGSAEEQPDRDKVTNGEWGGIGNDIALSYSTNILCCLCLRKLWGLGQSPD